MTKSVREEPFEDKDYMRYYQLYETNFSYEEQKGIKQKEVKV